MKPEKRELVEEANEAANAVPLARHRHGLLMRRICAVMLSFAFVSLLVHPARNCIHGIRQGFAPLSIEQRVKKILTNTPLIGAQNICLLYPGIALTSLVVPCGSRRLQTVTTTWRF